MNQALLMQGEFVMTRLTATRQWDVGLQWRNGFYYAALTVVVMWLLIASQIPAETLLWLLPMMLMDTYRKNKRPFHPSPTALDRS